LRKICNRSQWGKSKPLRGSQGISIQDIWCSVEIEIQKNFNAHKDGISRAKKRNVFVQGVSDEGKKTN